ncbi:Uncharacterised protein [Escherichia coli]|nr:Uncharacterised protein [Escherichia coli]
MSLHYKGEGIKTVPSPLPLGEGMDEGKKKNEMKISLRQENSILTSFFHLSLCLLGGLAHCWRLCHLCVAGSPP